MLGFFGSLLVGIKRENPYSKLPDLMPISSSITFSYAREIIENKGNLIDFEFTVHQQGYGLGERLFYNYIENKVSKKEIKRLFSFQFPEELEATTEFLKLKARFWPYSEYKD